MRLAAAALLLALPSHAAPLVTEAEAARPTVPLPVPTRALTRAPVIELDAPRGTVSPPFVFRVRYTARGGAKVDPDSVRVTLLRDPPADLTPRLKPSATAVELREAEAPPGTYGIRIELRDDGGRTASDVVRILVAPR